MGRAGLKGYLGMFDTQGKARTTWNDDVAQIKDRRDEAAVSLKRYSPTTAKRAILELRWNRLASWCNHNMNRSKNRVKNIFEFTRFSRVHLDIGQARQQDDKMPHDHSDTDHHHALLPPDPALRVKALETILEAKGLVDPAALDEIIDTYQNRIGPRNGARVVARAWKDPAFHDLLMSDATQAVSQLGFYGRQGEHIVAVENTSQVHNMVVCTLCSCYPWPILGIPPGWYKSDAYRARTVREPRKVLADFGVTLPETTAVRVWDSTAEIRYLVVPMRPEGTEGWSEDALADLVSRDAMIGTALVEAPR